MSKSRNASDVTKPERAVAPSALAGIFPAAKAVYRLAAVRYSYGRPKRQKSQSSHMLKRILIQNFRSCGDVVLDDLGNLTALIGRNGSGKTNILRAIAWLADSATSSEISFQDVRPVMAFDRGPMVLEADIELDGIGYRYSMLIEASPYVGDGTPTVRLAIKEVLERGGGEVLVDRNGELLHLHGRSNAITIGPAVPCLPAVMALLPPDAEQTLSHIRAVALFFSATRYYPLDETNELTGPDRFGFVMESDYKAHVASYRSGSGFQDIVTKLVFSYYEHKDKFNELSALLGDLGLGLIAEIIIREFAVGPEEKIFAASFRPGQGLGGGDRLFFYGDLSMGTRRVIRLLSSLVLDGSALMLVEHPEDGIHRGLVRKLIDLIQVYADPVQMIVSSHSAALLNQLSLKDIRLVSIESGSTEVRPLTPREVFAASRYVESEGTLADFVETVEE